MLPSCNWECLATNWTSFFSTLIPLRSFLATSVNSSLQTTNKSVKFGIVPSFSHLVSDSPPCSRQASKFEVSLFFFPWWEGTWTCSLLRVTQNMISKKIKDAFGPGGRSIFFLPCRGCWSKDWSWKQLYMRMQPKRNYFLRAMIKEVQARSDKIILKNN